MENRRFARLYAIPTFAAVIGTLFVAQNASAGVYLETNFKPVFEESNEYEKTGGGAFSGTDVNPDKTLGYDVHAQLGYAVWDKMIVGVGVNSFSTTWTRASTSTAEQLERKVSIFEWGPSIGYKGGGWRFVFTYLMSGERKIADKLNAQDGTVSANYDVTQKLSSGFQVSAGYAWNVTTNIALGPTLIYRTVSYNKETKSDKITPSNDYTDRDLSTKAVSTGLLPYLSAVVTF